MIIHKSIIHVLDKNSDSPILNDYECKNSLEVDKFFQKIINRVSKDDDLRKAIFNDYSNNIVKNCCEQIIYDENTFLKNSKEIAAYLFDIMQQSEGIDSCDLAICLYSVKNEKNVAIIKLDYRKNYTHSIDFIENKFNIQIISNEIGIPETSKPKQCALVGVSGINDYYHFRLLDKDAEKDQLETKFLTDFLNAKKIEDSKYKTKLFKKTTDSWITNAIIEDLKMAEDIRSMLNYTLKEKETVDVKEFAKSSIQDEVLQESFNERMEDRNLTESFEIDKKWVEKKLKNRSIKTDTGFSIKGNLADFEDPMKYSFRRNENGTYDIVLKNISFYEEK